MDSWTANCGKAGTDFFDIMSPHPALRTTGNFGQKFSQSGFAISLIHSNLPRSNARSELFLERNEHEAAMRSCIALTARKSLQNLLTRSRDGNNEFAVFLGDEVFRAAGGAAVGVLFLDLNDELFGWFECQANFAASG